jgi:FKBP-type peptidyl-prolyl cis-trans isomerase FkpA
MNKTQSPRRLTPVLVEKLEDRQLFSAVGSIVSATPPAPSVHEVPLLARADKASRRTTTTIQLSRHGALVGQPVVLTVTVKSAKGAARPAGTIEIIDNGTTVQAGSAGPLDLTLSPAGRAAYRFQVGNVALFPGVHNLSALFSGSNDLFASLSKSTSLLVRTPKPKPAADGFAGATIQAARGSASVKAGQTVTVSYTGFLQGNGAVFDYANAHTPASLTFMVQASPEAVIGGFDRGVLGMKVGEIRVLVIPSALGYGAGGSGNIPPGADLLFLVKLQSIT